MALRPPTQRNTSSGLACGQWWAWIVQPLRSNPKSRSAVRLVWTQQMGPSFPFLSGCSAALLRRGGGTCLVRHTIRVMFVFLGKAFRVYLRST